MSRFRTIGKKMVRRDGLEKATGKLKFMADYKVDGMLYGKILFSSFFRAEIIKIDCSEAKGVEGVSAVVTAADIPGSASRGLIYQDHPVLCDKEVNYRGDVIAVVVAETEEAAVLGCELIKVKYKELPFVLSADEALKSDAPQIHSGGNIAAHMDYTNCDDMDSVFKNAPFVFEETFETGYQEHAYLEPEGGFAVPMEDGGVDIWYGCQNGHRARRDLTAILDLPLDKIDVHSHPLGGGFGGKDDLLLQGLLGICALKCGKPVMINLTREESFRMGPKRIPYRISMKTAVDEEGQFLANRIRILGTAGAYACYTPAILDYSLQVACGIYSFPSIDVAGDIVYTNGPLVSAFRGFGNNQVSFAMESMVDIIAERLGIGKVEIRRRNIIRPGLKHNFGNLCSTSYYTGKLMDKVEDSALLKRADAFKSEVDKPWLKRGIGIATVQQGQGLGNNVIPDASGAEIHLLENGRLQVAFGNEDMGQGNITTLLAIASEAMHMPMELLDYVNGITSRTPDSGPITASRTTYITGKAICCCIEKLHDVIARELRCDVKELELSDEGINGKSWDEIAKLLSAEDRIHFHREVFVNEPVDINIGLNLFFSHAALVAGVEVNTLTGETRVLETEVISSSGTIINPLGYEGQCEGGVVMSQGFALYEDFKPECRNYQTYMIPTIADCPEIKVTPIEDPEETGPFGAKGLGEVIGVPGTPAIINAIHDAVGIRFKKIPAGPQALLMALGEWGAFA